MNTNDNYDHTDSNNYSDGKTPHEHLFSLSVDVSLCEKESVCDGVRANESECE